MLSPVLSRKKQELVSRPESARAMIWCQGTEACGMGGGGTQRATPELHGHKTHVYRSLPMVVEHPKGISRQNADHRRDGTARDRTQNWQSTPENPTCGPFLNEEQRAGPQGQGCILAYLAASSGG